MQLRICTTILALAASGSTLAQDAELCPPMANPMETTRIPLFEEGVDPTDLLTVSACDVETYSMVADYTTPLYPAVGIHSLRGKIEATNKRATSNRITFDGSSYIGDDLVPFYAPSQEFCWDEDKGRIHCRWSITVDANADGVQEIGWDIELRKKDQTADINGDGRVDAADHGIMLASWNSDDWRTDLNRDGTTNSADLGILFAQWSNTSKDQ